MTGLHPEAVENRQLMIRAGRGDAAAQSDLARFWMAQAETVRGKSDDLETEAMSYALMFARLAEANTGGMLEKGLLLTVLQLGIDVRGRLGDDWSVSQFTADAILLIDAAADLPGFDTLGDVSDAVAFLVEQSSPAEVEAAQAMKGFYHVAV